MRFARYYIESRKRAGRKKQAIRAWQAELVARIERSEIRECAVNKAKLPPGFAGAQPALQKVAMLSRRHVLLGSGCALAAAARRVTRRRAFCSWKPQTSVHEVATTMARQRPRLWVKIRGAMAGDGEFRRCGPYVLLRTSGAGGMGDGVGVDATPSDDAGAAPPPPAHGRHRVAVSRAARAVTPSVRTATLLYFAGTRAAAPTG